MPTYVVARSAKGRPTLQHALVSWNTTACGLDVTAWSRAYQEAPITEIVCKKCRRLVIPTRDGEDAS
jgi:hypothetical protein